MGKITEAVLEKLQEGAEITVDLLGFMMADKHTSYRRMRHSHKYGPKQFKKEWADIYRKKQRFYKMFNHLKKQGFIKKEIKKGGSLWSLTKRGVERLITIKEQQKNPFSWKTIDFQKPIGNELTIISFDVPEKERRKREWIRRSLLAMDFQYIQKSVWFSKGKVDEAFIRALGDRDLFGYVHIFSISQSGTIALKRR